MRLEFVDINDASQIFIVKVFWLVLMSRESTAEMIGANAWSYRQSILC